MSIQNNKTINTFGRALKLDDAILNEKSWFIQIKYYKQEICQWKKVVILSRKEKKCPTTLEEY